MADLNRREERLADVVMECWEATQPLVDTLIAESFPVGPPPNSTILDDESQYNLQVTMTVESFQAAFAAILLEQYADSGEYSMREFTQQLSKEYRRFQKSTHDWIEFRKADDVLPSEAILRYRFDRTSPTAEAYAVKSSASMVSDIADSNITGVRTLVGRAFQEQRTYQQTATALTALLSETVPLNSVAQKLGQAYGINANGLFPRYANAVANYAERTAAKLAKDGVTGSKALKIVQDRSDKYAQKLRRSRAKMISRTEIMRANNAGRLAASDQAAAKGLFDRDKAKRQWISAPQDSCFICGPLNEVAVPYNETWYEGEPAYVHPNCRCTWILLPNVAVNGIPTVTGTGTAANPFVWSFANQSRALPPSQLLQGGSAAGGAASTIPEPKPIQSTAVVDEVVPTPVEPSVVDEVTDIVDEVTDVADDLFRGHKDIDDFVENFEWNTESFTGTRGQTWKELDPKDREYLVAVMIDEEIMKGIDGIDELSSFVFDDQGYKLMAGAPKEVAEEIQELQQEVFEKLQAVERNEKLKTIQVRQRGLTLEEFKAEFPEIADEAMQAGTMDTGRLVYVADLPPNATISGRQFIDLDQAMKRAGVQQNSTLYKQATLEDSGSVLDWRSVNERMQYHAWRAYNQADEIADEAMRAVQKLGAAMEREVQRRVDDITAAAGVRALDPDQILADKKNLDELLGKLNDRAKNSGDVRRTEAWYKGGTGETVLLDNAEYLLADGSMQAADDGLEEVLSLLKDVKVPDELLGQLDDLVDYSTHRLLTPSSSTTLKTGKTISQVFDQPKHGFTNPAWLDEVGRSGRIPTHLNPMSGDAYDAGTKGFHNWAELMNDIASGKPVPIEVLQDAVELMDTLRMLDAQSRFIDDAIWQRWDNFLVGLQKRVDDAYHPSTPNLEARIIAGNRTIASDSYTMRNASKAAADDLTSVNRVLSDISEANPNIVLEVKETSIDAVEKLIDDWIYLESRDAKFLTELPSAAKESIKDIPLGMEAGEAMAGVTIKKAGLKARIANLRELIAEPVEEGINLGTGMTNQAIRAKRIRDEFDNIVNDFIRRHTEVSQSTTNVSTQFAQEWKNNWKHPMTGSLPDAATQGVRTWSLRGTSMNSGKRINDVLDEIFTDYVSQLSDKDIGEALLNIKNESPYIARVLGRDADGRVQSLRGIAARVEEGVITLDEGIAFVKEMDNNALAYRNVMQDIMAGDLKTSTHSYDSFEVAIQRSQDRFDLTDIITRAKTENLAGGMEIADAVDLGLIRQQVLREARDTGGSIEFGIGLKPKGGGTNLKEVKSLSSKCGERLSYDILDPQTGAVLARRGDKLSPAQYRKFAQMMADEAMESVPSSWITRMKSTADLDQVDEIKNGSAGTIGSNRSIGFSADARKNGDKYSRDGFYFHTAPDSPNRAHAFTFQRGIDAERAPSFNWTSQMDEVPDTIFMVDDGFTMRGGSINITYNDLNQSTMGHELQHLFQNQNRAFAQLEKAWYRSRIGYAADETRIGNPAYRPQPVYKGTKEMGIPNEIGELYTLKYYKDTPFDYWGTVSSGATGEISPVFGQTIGNISTPELYGTQGVGRSQWFQSNGNHEGTAMLFQDLFDTTTMGGPSRAREIGNLPRYAKHFDEDGVRLFDPVMGEVDDDIISFYLGMYGGY
jgi:hypothetical protein